MMQSSFRMWGRAHDTFFKENIVDGVGGKKKDSSNRAFFLSHSSKTNVENSD